MSSTVNDRESWDEGGSKNYAFSGKIMLSAIIILFVVLVFMILLHVYARWYLLRFRRRYLHRRRTRRSRPTHIVFYVDPAIPNPALPSQGLEAAVLASLPVFVYKSAGFPDGLDCAVCLSEFEEEEKGRILPKCHHSFHTECVDMWFHSHSTCPICRAPVEPAPVQNENRSVPSSSISTGDDVGSSSLADRRKGVDLVGVRIEVPRRSESMNELRLSSPASHGFRSPVNRLQSLKRILSMNRKSVAVSPTLGTGPSCGSGVGELDVELGKCESTRFPTPR